MANTISFEEKLRKLEEISDILDKGSLGLDEMLKLYEEGMSLVKQCREYLDKAELKVIEINKSSLNNQKE